jgi:ribosomal protein L11 methyltransferase
LVPLDVDVDAFTSALRQILSLPDEFEPVQVESVAQGGWVELVNQTFAPMHVAGPVWVVPAWNDPLDVVPAGATAILIDPGIAFGTGDHATTQLCMRWLLENVEEGDTVLDMGCGSGILGITALVTGGASAAVGVDIDPAAVTSSRTNHGLNWRGREGVTEREWGERLQVMLPGEFEAGRLNGVYDDGTFDVVVANILAGPLVELAPLHAAMARPGTGKLCLSGILAEQLEDVGNVYAEYFDILPADDNAFEGGWARLEGRRKQGP